MALGLLAAASGCRQDMHNQPKAIPLRESMFFKNGSSAPPLVHGTVARGTLHDDAAFFTGKSGATVVDALPLALTAEVLDRGEQRFNIYFPTRHGFAGGRAAEAFGGGGGRRGAERAQALDDYVDQQRTSEASESRERSGAQGPPRARV